LTTPPGHLWRDKWTALSGPLSVWRLSPTPPPKAEPQTLSISQHLKHLLAQTINTSDLWAARGVWRLSGGACVKSAREPPDLPQSGRSMSLKYEPSSEPLHNRDRAGCATLPPQLQTRREGPGGCYAFNPKLQGLTFAQSGESGGSQAAPARASSSSDLGFGG